MPRAQRSAARTRAARGSAARALRALLRRVRAALPEERKERKRLPCCRRLPYAPAIYSKEEEGQLCIFMCMTCAVMALCGCHCCGLAKDMCDRLQQLLARLYTACFCLYMPTVPGGGWHGCDATHAVYRKRRPSAYMPPCELAFCTTNTHALHLLLLFYV